MLLLSMSAHGLNFYCHSIDFHNFIHRISYRHTVYSEYLAVFSHQRIKKGRPVAHP